MPKFTCQTIVIVIVIGYRLGATFFFKSGTLIFAFFCITILDVRHETPYTTHKTPPPCLRFAFAFPPLQKWTQNESKEASPTNVSEANNSCELVKYVFERKRSSSVQTVLSLLSHGDRRAARGGAVDKGPAADGDAVDNVAGARQGYT